MTAADQQHSPDYGTPCRHCGKPPEADGDHSCTCPHPDDFCPDHPRPDDPWHPGGDSAGARQFDRTMLMTWPYLAVTLNLLPWHWRVIPRGWYDYSPRGADSAGWWGIDGEWLFVKVSFGFNLPPFDSPWIRVLPPASDGGVS